MGHGICLTYNKQSALVGPNGRATSDDKTIGALSWKLLKSLDIPPHELRGLGIQIQKLENSTAPAPDPGQARLPFRPVISPRKGEASTSKRTISDDTLPVPAIHVLPTSQDSDVIEIDIPTVDAISGGPNLDLPSYSQVDKSVLDALPDDVRREIESEYKRRSASPAVSVPLSRDPSPAVGLADQAPKIRVKGTKASNLSRITRQLAPRTKPLISPTKSSLFNALPRAGPSAVRITEAELRKLGLDPTVFAELPVEFQREQLAQARGALTSASQRPVRPTKPLKPPTRLGGRWRTSRTPHEYIPPPPPPQAVFIAPPVLRQPGPEKGVKLAFWEGEDVQRLLEEWVKGFGEHPPHMKDVEYFAKYLVKCVETDVGVERAVGVMRWWGVLLRRTWGIWEHSEDDSDDGGLDSDGDGENENGRVTSEVIGKAWWRAYRDVKTRMNEVSRKRFGGSLSFR